MKVHNPQKIWCQDEPGPEMPPEEVSRYSGLAIDDLEKVHGGFDGCSYRINKQYFLKVTPGGSSRNKTETAFSRFPWEHLCVPEVVSASEHHILNVWKTLDDVSDDAETGIKVGFALAEIHGSNNQIDDRPNAGLANLFSDAVVFRNALENLLCRLKAAKPNVAGSLEHCESFTSVMQDLENNSVRWETLFDEKVRLHGDFKPGNVKVCSGMVYAFDFSFSFIGPRFVDVWHFMRHGVSKLFYSGFCHGYQQLSGIDLRYADVRCRFIDQLNMLGQLIKCKTGSIRERDTLAAVEANSDYVIKNQQSSNNSIQTDAFGAADL
jgi:fructosamine-3-kinase